MHKRGIEDRLLICILFLSELIIKTITASIKDSINRLSSSFMEFKICSINIYLMENEFFSAAAALMDVSGSTNSALQIFFINELIWEWWVSASRKENKRAKRSESLEKTREPYKFVCLRSVRGVRTPRTDFHFFCVWGTFVFTNLCIFCVFV